MKYLRQSTPATIPVGPMLSKADGFTPLTALLDQVANGRLIKNGVGSAMIETSWAHDAAGTYLVGLTAGDTDTLGRLRIGYSDPTTFLPVWEDFSVLSQAVYDSLFGTVSLVPDNADIVTSLADLVTLVASIGLIKAQTDKLAALITGTQFNAQALALTPNVLALSGYTIHIGAQASPAIALTFRVGEANITIQEVLRYSDGTSINLAGKTVRFQLVPAIGGVATFDHAAASVWDGGGVGSVTLPAADFLAAANFNRRWIVSDISGGEVIYPESGTLPLAILA